MNDQSEIAEVLAKLREVLRQHDRCIQEYAHAFRMYSIELPEGTQKSCSEECCEIARILDEDSSAIETIAKLEVVRAKLVRYRIDVHGAVANHLGKSLKEKIRATNKAQSLQPASRTLLQEIEREQIKAVDLARHCLAARGGQPDAALKDIQAALRALQTADNRFEQGIASLKEAESALDRALTRINDGLHSVGNNVEKSDRNASLLGIVGIVVGVVGIAVAVLTAVFH